MKIFTPLSLLTAFILAFPFGGIAEDDHDAFYWSKISSHIKIDVKKNSYTRSVLFEGVVRSADEVEICLTENELERIKSIKWNRTTEAKLRKVKNSMIRAFSDPGNSFYDGYKKKCFDISGLKTDETFKVEQVSEGSEIMTLSFLPFYSESEVDTFYYEVEVPDGYNVSYKYDGDFSSIDKIYDGLTADESTGVKIYSFTAVAKKLRRKHLPYSGVQSHIHRAGVDPAENLSKWYAALVSTKSRLNKHTIQGLSVHCLQEDDPGQIVNDLSAFVATKFRYIDYENGIQAYQPDDVNVVFNRKYGDCKDLSNLLVQSFRHYGLESNLALCATKNHLSKSSFPGLSSFNHVVCVVKVKDEWRMIDPINLKSGSAPVDMLKNEKLLLIGNSEIKWLDLQKMDDGLGFFHLPEFPNIDSPPIDNMFLEDVPEEFKNAEVVLLYESVERHYQIDFGRLVTEENIHRRFKIQSHAGAQNFAEMSVPVCNDWRMKSLKCTTIKPDGRRIILGKNAVKKLEFSNAPQGEAVYLFAVPDLASNDIIDLRFSLKSFSAGSGEKYHFYADLPKVESVLTLKVDKALDVHFKECNLDDPGHAVEDFDFNIYTWKSANNPGVNSSELCSFAYAFPSVLYEIRLKEKSWNGHRHPSNWLELLHDISDHELLIHSRKVDALDPLYAGFVSRRKVKNEVRAITAFHQYMNENIEVVRDESIDKISIDDQFRNLRMSESSILKMYNDFLNKTSSNYYIACAKRRTEGHIDLDFPSRLQINRLLFIVEDDDGQLHMLFPKTRRSEYSLSEVPSEYQGTDVLMYNPNEPDRLRKLRLPIAPAKSNSFVRNGVIELKISEDRIKGQIWNSYSGVPATTAGNDYGEKKRTHTLYSHLKKIIECTFQNPQIGSIILVPTNDESGKKLDFSFNFVSELPYSEEVVRFPLGKLFPHKLFSDSKLLWSERMDASLNPNHLKFEFINYKVKLDQEATLEIHEWMNLALVDGFFTYYFNLSQTGPKEIEIKSHFEINDLEIGAESVQGLKEVSEFLMGLRDREIRITIK